MSNKIRIAEYAVPAHQERPFNLGDYCFQVVTIGLFLFLLILPTLFASEELKDVFNDFGLKLPSSTQLLFDVAELLQATRAYTWLWIVPVVVPLGTARLTSKSKHRIGVLAILSASIFGVTAMYALYLPFLRLFHGLSQ